MITLQDISNSLKISKATISLVLNGRGDEKRVSKETQERIIRFAKENNYNANMLARGLSRGKSDMIGLVIPNISDSFFARVARRIEKRAELFGYNVIFSSTGESKIRESKLIRTMLDRKVDGLIIATSQKNEQDILALKQQRIPFVLVDRHYPEIETSFVGMDNMTGIATVVERFIKSNRNRIGFVTLTDELEPLHKRLESYMMAMEKFGYPCKADYIKKLKYDSYETDMNEIISELVFKSGIEGIIFSTHFLAAEGLRQLKKMKLMIPDDVAIVSFGQMNDFDLTAPSITSIILPADDIGDTSVEILLKCMKEETLKTEQITIDTDLVIRDSCGTA